MSILIFFFTLGVSIIKFRLAPTHPTPQYRRANSRIHVLEEFLIFSLVYKYLRSTMPLYKNPLFLRIELWMLPSGMGEDGETPCLCSELLRFCEEASSQALVTWSEQGPRGVCSRSWWSDAQALSPHHTWTSRCFLEAPASLASHGRMPSAATSS